MDTRILDFEAFSKGIELLRLRFFVSDELAAAYYEELKQIPSDRFDEICRAIFRECDFFPKPLRFLEISSEIGARQILVSDTPEEDGFTEEQRQENLRRISEMVRSLSKSVSFTGSVGDDCEF